MQYVSKETYNCLCEKRMNYFCVPFVSAFLSSFKSLISISDRCYVFKYRLWLISSHTSTAQNDIFYFKIYNCSHFSLAQDTTIFGHHKTIYFLLCVHPLNVMAELGLIWTLSPFPWHSLHLHSGLATSLGNYINLAWLKLWFWNQEVPWFC